MAIIRNRVKWNPETKRHERISSEVTYEGRVTAVYTQDYRAMSDVYTLATMATVVEADGKIAQVLVNANFECDVSGDTAEVDASPEALEIFQAHNEALRAAKAAAFAARMAQRELEIENTPVIGKKMTVATGRKVKVGTTGTVAFISNTGNVLLKADAMYTNRQANGVWVDRRHLVLRRPCTAHEDCAANAELGAACAAEKLIHLLKVALSGFTE